MTQTLSEKLKGLFKKTDVYLGKALDKKPSGSKFIGPSQRDYKMYKAGQSTSKALAKIGLGGKTIPSKSKALVTAKTAAKFKKLAPLAKAVRFARAATPIGLGVEAGILAYKVATMSPEKKAKVKALKAKIKKQDTKDYHKNLLKLNTGGGTMLKNPKKADLDKDGNLSSYEKKRGKAIESNMMSAETGKMINFKEFVKKESGAQVSPNEVENLKKKYLKKIRAAKVGPAEEMKLMGGKLGKMKEMKMFSDGAKKGKMMSAETGKFITKKKTEYIVKKKNKYITKKPREEIREREMVKKSMGGEMKSTQGYGAARTSGMGLQDESLPTGKSLDYYKDLL